MKKPNNIKVVCFNSKEDFEKVSEKYTLFIAELVKSGQIGWGPERKE